jgi:hypothetical protein
MNNFNAVATALDVALLCNVTKKVFKDAPAADLIEKAIKEFLAINEVRTRVAHGLWVPFMDGGTVQHVHRTSRELHLDTGQADKLEKHSDRLSSLRRELENALN